MIALIYVYSLHVRFHLYLICLFIHSLVVISCLIILKISGALIGEEFRNRKGYFSLNVQAVCDADLKLMNVIARWPGSTHDATIFNNSILRGCVLL